MLLTLDVGNSHIHAGLFDGDTLILQFRYNTVVGMTSDEMGVFLKQVIKENDISPSQLVGCSIASVVPDINYSISSAMIKYFDIKPFFLQTGVKTGLKMKVSTPKSVGPDRISACIAAVEMFPNKNILVIDIGTATVFDIVTKDKSYLSGAIIGGLKISASALSSQTSQLPIVSIVKPEVAIGKDTETNIQSGLYFGHLGALKEIKKAMLEELKIDSKDVITIATGGFSYLFSDSNVFDTLIPDLLLQGLKISYQKNN